MLRRILHLPTDDAPDDPDDRPPRTTSACPRREPDLAALPVVGITRRRIAIGLGVLLAVWIVIVFARQVSEAAAATGPGPSRWSLPTRPSVPRSTALEGELTRIQEPSYVLQQARGYRLGDPHEIPFTLDPDAPTLGARRARFGCLAGRRADLGQPARIAG